MTNQIHTIKEQGAQGDVMFIRVQNMPEGLQKEAQKGDIVIAHSETGHNHAISADTDAHLFREPSDPLTCYLMVESDFADVIHHRSFDTHETLRLPKGLWKIRRQREYVPEGWRRVED